MIRVGVDARVLAKPGVEGVIRYARELLRALGEREAGRGDGEGGLEYRLFGVEAVPDDLAGYDAIRSAGVPARTHSGPRAHLWEQTVLPRAVARDGVDVFHAPAGLPPLAADVPLVTTVHDLSPLDHPEWFSRGYAAIYRALTPLVVRRSARLVAVSDFTRGTIVSRWPAAGPKTVAVPNGHRPPAEAPDAAVPALADRPFLLSVASSNPRKNVDGLLAAYRRYRRRADDPAALALVGLSRDIFADGGVESVDAATGTEARRVGARQPDDGVRRLGFVDDDRLGWLYRHAAAFVFPSTYEGFGLPILEAMSVGTPVVTADRGAMAEVAGDAACLVDPTDHAALATGIERVLAEPGYADRLVERGRERASAFTWAETARRTAAVFREVARCESSR